MPEKQTKPIIVSLKSMEILLKEEDRILWQCLDKIKCLGKKIQAEYERTHSGNPKSSEKIRGSNSSNVVKIIVNVDGIVQEYFADKSIIKSYTSIFDSFEDMLANNEFNAANLDWYNFELFINKQFNEELLRVSEIKKQYRIVDPAERKSLYDEYHEIVLGLHRIPQSLAEKFWSAFLKREQKNNC